MKKFDVSDLNKFCKLIESSDVDELNNFEIDTEQERNNKKPKPLYLLSNEERSGRI